MIFLFSLPRSGSTLLQRMLSRHSKISSVSEPWLLLPFIYSLKTEGQFTEYSHRAGVKALKDFVKELPLGETDYLSELKKFSLALYGKASKPEALYFLDKTPRYYLIIPEIARMFPEAKFIFLYRNPLQVLSSVIETWGKGNLSIYNNHIDLFRGPELLSQGCRMLQGRSIRVEFNDLVRSPEDEMQRILNYLGLNPEIDEYKNVSEIQFKGRVGDRTGASIYQEVDPEPMEKWKIILNTRIKLLYAERYLKYLGEDNLKSLGYEFKTLKKELEKIKVRKFGVRDIKFLILDVFVRSFEPILFMKKLQYRIKHKKAFDVHT